MAKRGFALVLGLCFGIGFGPGFIGIGARARASGSVTCKGWRLDKIEVGPGGIGQLVVAEGFFIGEKASKQKESAPIKSKHDSLDMLDMLKLQNSRLCPPCE